MKIDKESQVRLLNIISQTKIDSIDDLPIDVDSNRIKARKGSLDNISRNVINVPMSSNLNVVESVVSDDKKYSIIDNGIGLVEDGNKKPINVNDTMLKNIKKSGNLTNTSIDNRVDEESIIKESSFNNDTAVVRIPTSVNDINDSISHLIDFEKSIVLRVQTVKKMKEELEKSNVLLQELSMQYTEVEKKLMDAENRNSDLEKQIVLKLKNQEDLLKKRLVDIENLESKISEQKDNNEAKILDFQSKIKSVLEKTNDLNQEASRKEEILDSIDKKYFDSEEEVFEQSVKKIA